MTINLRRSLLIAFGAAASLPLAFRNSGAFPVAAVISPLLVGALLFTGDRAWRELWNDRVARLLLLLLVFSAVSLPLGPIVYHKLEGLRSYAYQVALVLNFAAGFLVLRGWDDVKDFFRGFVAASGVIAIGLDVYLLRAGVLTDVHLFHTSEALMAVYGWPNAYSVLLAVALIMCIYILASTESPMARRVYSVLGVGIAACLVLTFSKTGWVVFAFAAWLLWMRFWRPWQLIAVASAVVVLLLGLYIFTNDSFRTQLYTVGTLQERYTIIESVFKYVSPAILAFGSGGVNIETLLKPYAQIQIVPGVYLGTLTTHDEFLTILVKGGVLSLIVFVAAIVIVVLRTRRLTRSGEPASQRLARFWYSAMWAIVLSMLAGELLHYWPIAAPFWIMAGAIARLLPMAESVSVASAGKAPEHALPAS